MKKIVILTIASIIAFYAGQASATCHETQKSRNGNSNKSLNEVVTSALPDQTHKPLLDKSQQDKSER